MDTLKRITTYEMLFLTLVLALFTEFSLLNFNYFGNAADISEEDSVIRPIITAKTELKNNILSVNEEIELNNRLSEVFLNVTSNIYGKTKITNVTPQAYKTEFLNDGCALKLSFFEETKKIIIKYEIVLSNENEILSYRDDKVLLTEFLITPAPIINDNPILAQKCAFGDPFTYQMHDYDIELKVNPAYQVFAPGMVYKINENGNDIYLFNAKSIRDFPIALFKDAQIKKSKIRDIDIIFVDLPDIEKEVADAFNFIEEKTGLYPYKEFFIINAPIKQQGMEFSQMIFISESIVRNKSILSKILYHEIFHQWFYGMVGTDQVNEPYMDEGLVNYLAILKSKQNVGSDYDNKIFNLKLNDYKSKAEFYDFVYNESTSYFCYLDSILDFDILLKNIFDNYFGKILTKKDLDKEISLLKGHI